MRSLILDLEDIADKMIYNAIIDTYGGAGAVSRDFGEKLIEYLKDKGYEIKKLGDE